MKILDAKKATHEDSWIQTTKILCGKHDDDALKIAANAKAIVQALKSLSCYACIVRISNETG